MDSVPLPYLAKLLLQTDDNPLVGSQDVHAQLLAAAGEDRVKAAVSPRGPGVAVALDQRLVVVGAGGEAVEFATVVAPKESVTALAWLAAPGQPTDDCLMLGTSEGFLQLHSPSGQLLLRQDVHDTALVSISVRWSGMGVDHEDLSEDITICAAGAVLRVPCLDVWAVVRWHAGKRERGWWGVAPTAPQLTFSKWALPKGTGPRTYALSLGAPLPSLYTVLTGRQQGAKVQVFTAGSGPPIATLEADEAKGAGLLSLVTGLASTTASGLLQRARGTLPTLPTLPGRGTGGGGGGEPKRAKIPGDPATVAASVWDEKRVVTRVSPSPCGTLAACCDSLGRVMLVDTAATLVSRMLKGYRDAQVAWVVGPASLQQRQRQRQQEAAPAAGAHHEQQAQQPPLESLDDWEARWSEAASSDTNDGPTAAGRRQQQQQQGRDSEGDGPPVLPNNPLLQPRNTGGSGDGSSSSSRAGSFASMSAGSSSGGGGGGGEPSSRLRQLEAAGAAAGLGGPHREGQQQQGHQQQGQQQQEQQDEQQQQAQQGQEVYVVVYAPRRAVVELWQPHTGRRVAAMHYPSQHGVLLQTPAWRAGPGRGPAAAGAPGAARYEPNAAWMLCLESLRLVNLWPAMLGG